MDRKRVLEIYTWLVIGVGAGAVAYCVYTVNIRQLDFMYVLLCLATIFLSSRFTIHIPNDGGHITIADTLIFLVMLLYGGGPTVFLGAAEGAYTSLPYRQQPQTVAFNGAIVAIATAAPMTRNSTISGTIPASTPRSR